MLCSVFGLEHRRSKLTVVSISDECCWCAWCQVSVFGSVKTGLFLPSSDIDIVVFGRWNNRPLHTLSDMLVSEGVSARNDIKVIEKATVSTLQFLFDFLKSEITTWHVVPICILLDVLVAMFLKHFHYISFD